MCEVILQVNHCVDHNLSNTNDRSSHLKRLKILYGGGRNVQNDDDAFEQRRDQNRSSLSQVSKKNPESG